MYKIYPSSFSMPIGRTVDTGYYNKCLRFLKYKQYLPEHVRDTKFPELNKAIGTIGEERVRHLLEERYPESKLLIEESFKQHPSEHFEISGRCDFMLHSENLIVEVKTTRSPSMRTKVINKGELPDTYLGQLITYMIHFDITQGEIFVSYVHFTKDKSSLGFVDRVFKVTIDGDNVYIDGEEFDRTVGSILDFYALYMEHMASDKIPPKPKSDNPCYRCPFKQLCYDLDAPASNDEFIDRAKNVEIDYSSAMPEARLKAHNIRKPKV